MTSPWLASPDPARVAGNRKPCTCRAARSNASRVAERDWAAAYPQFGAPEAFAPFQLAEVCKIPTTTCAAFCML